MKKNRSNQIVRGVLSGIAVLSLTAAAHADKALCEAGLGQYVAGEVRYPPYLRRTAQKPKKADGENVFLSQTHLGLVSDLDGQLYDVVLENIFAEDFDPKSLEMPEAYRQIKQGDHLELCGKVFDKGYMGIGRLHTNCGATPSAGTPDGWVKLVEDGEPGDNLAENRTYCRLFKN